MTGTAFKTMVASVLNRTDMTNIIATMSAVAVKKLEREKFWFQYASTSLAATAAQTSVSYPSDFLFEVADGLNDSAGVPLEKKDLATLTHWQVYSPSTGSKNAYYAMADAIYLYPNQASTNTMRYIKSLGFPADTSSNAWTDTVYDLTMWATVEEVWRYLRNTEEQSKAQAQKLLILKDIRYQSGQIVGTGRVEYQEF